MALDLRTSFRHDPSRSGHPGSHNLELEPTQGCDLQRREGNSKFQVPQLSLYQTSNGSFAKQELKRLRKVFHLWLQPEKHSKEEIISQLILEQLVMNGYCRNRSILKEKWDSSGRNLEKLVGELNDDCMKSPDFVHVHMQGQEALFSENMPLREVIYLMEQMPAGTPRGESMRTPFQGPQNIPLQTGHGDEYKDDSNIFVKRNQINVNITSQGNQVPYVVIIQEDDSPKPEEGSGSWKNLHNFRRAELGSPTSQEGSLGESSSQDVPMEVETQFLPRTDQASPKPALTNQSSDGTSRCGINQERVHSPPKSYKCEDCPRIFRFPSQLEAHQRRHRNERPFVCTECHKGFFQTSDLHVHQKIHMAEKPFRCSSCERSFSHKTNLLAHERIHSGDKPYVCCLCKKSYRQSSTYHRHVRMHQKINLKSDSATPEASSATALTKDL
ncbi:zinc finger and SCAN domain-containing protein 4-like [Dasypus novemcinctus]|uniref:zinc finger and SCAN domain-containing protein 4-like n=1 Tax=Dasypus novemcinctus TaxID=9361 RepID=UPI00265E302A|nr:zinc finger and SCAN domain-containing protein 4-like [Dasypus novemcinctus]